MAKRTFGERVYRKLLRLYPRDFSEDYGDEMARLYRDRVRGEGASTVWFAFAADLARTAPREQVSTFVQDVRHAWRTWRRTPVLALAAVLTLALGVGANTAVFSVVYGVLLKPLPYPDADRLVEIFEDNTREGGGPYFRVSLLNYLTWVERASSFGALAAFAGRDFTLTEHGDPERILGSAVTASMFDVLGVQPIVGRPFSVEDERPGAPPVALLAESLWRRGFGGDPSVVGRSIVLNDTRHRIVGIVPTSFREVGRTQIGSASAAQIIVPLSIEFPQSRGNHTLRVVGRLRPEISLVQSRDEMHRLAAAMEEEFAATNRNWGIRIERLHDSMFDPRVRVSLLLVLGAVAVVLVIACANVANLLLARATSGQREFALRAALGARPARLARQLLTESVSLAMVSGACGLAAAIIWMQALRTLVPTTIARVDEISLDWSVLAFGLLITSASGLFFGIAPAIHGARVNLVSALTQSGRGVLGSSRERWRRALVIAQTGLATTLIVLAALLLQSLVRLQLVPLGFEPTTVMTARLSAPRVRYPDAAATLAFHQTLLGSLESLPSVRAVGLITSAPFGPGVRRRLTLQSTTSSVSSQAPASAVEQVVSSGLFRALGVTLLAGREFGTHDQPGSPPVAILSDGLARRLWSDADAVGRTIEFDGRSHQVVGVVEDIRGNDGTGIRGGGLEREPSPIVYLSAAQFPQSNVSLVIRTDTQLEAIVHAIRAAVRDIDPSQPIADVRPLEEWIAESAAQPRLTTTLAGLFASAALFLTAIGIYGVLSYTVSQRTQEIGVRIAIGAARLSVVGLVLRGGMTLAGSGILLGLLCAWAVSRAASSLLFGVAAGDPFTFAMTALALAMVAGLACAMPAVRAARIDPMIALRSD